MSMPRREGVSLNGLSSSENIWLPCDDLYWAWFREGLFTLFILWSLVPIILFMITSRLILVRHSLLNSFGNPLFDVRLREALADFGPEPEFVSHNTVKGLSGGQKKNQKRLSHGVVLTSYVLMNLPVSFSLFPVWYSYSITFLLT